MTTPPTPQPQPAPLPERIETALAWRDRTSGEDLMYGPTPDWMRPPDYRALLAETAAALAAAQEREAVLREALAFYADTENYRGTGVPYLLISTGEVEDDWGTIARDALGGQS